ncbi:major facilitator superfamily domain-containing protein 1-like [Rhipicephalus sanguineus]|uniref:major facilitator superfamily domain-containing protein 1-like n=1 Tax=Rhipicephalus sanguineus TaxID=34632 RepID=UPI001894D488|nr:major facilitator superfamily domain-containing protein 1-like [Rhipicephalus sanguineus]
MYQLGTNFQHCSQALTRAFYLQGSTANFMTMPFLYAAVAKVYPGFTGLGVALLVAASWCVMSMLCAVVLAILDRRAQRIMGREDAMTGEVVKLTDVRYFPKTFWLLCFICVSYYVTIFPFIGLGTVFFQRKYQFSAVEANSVDSVPYLISAFASPVFGILVDLLGRNLIWVTVAVFGTLAAHGLLAFTFLNPWVAMVLMGLMYSLLACAFWPLVAMVIPEHQLGTAYGIMQSVQNLGLAVIAMVSGMIVDSSGYFVLEVFLMAWLCCKLASCSLTYECVVMFMLLMLTQQNVHFV